MEDHSGCDRGSGILPVALLWAVFACSYDHVGYVLRVGDVARGSDSNFRKWVESGAVSNFDGRELEADVALSLAETGSLGPILAFNVVDHG